MKRLLLIAGLAAGLASLSFFIPSQPDLILGSITASSTTYATAGTFTYKVSTNACTVDVAAWGGGGSGFDGSNSGGGAGGGGGAFASSTITVTPGTSITIVVGAGGVGSAANGASSTYNGTTVVADAGGGGKDAATTGGIAGLASLSTGITKKDGGIGGIGNGGDDSGGGGGGAGGPHGNGGRGADASATAGGGGGGGNGGNAGVGTSGGSSTNGGAGGNGGNGGVCAVGANNANGGGGSGGADQAGTACTAGAPGGGAGGAETTGPWNGAAGQIILTEFVNSAGCTSVPTVTTQSASSVANTTATANGNITDAGAPAPTVRGFAWGTSATMNGDTATTTDTAGQPFSAGAFTGSLTGLVGNTTYYTRAYATNTTGTGLGAISASFLTLPGTPGTPTASGMTTTAATLTWTDPAGGAASYKIERCTGTGCSSFAEIATGISSPYADSTLWEGTVFVYRVRATNTTGDGAYSASSADVTTLSSTRLPIKSGSLKVNSGVLRVH